MPASCDGALAAIRRDVRRFFALLLATTAMLAATIAAAEPAAPASATSESAYALSVHPVSWLMGTATVTSGLRLTKHQALRGNIASYPFRELKYAATESTYAGRITDVSAGWECFPRSVWDGFSIVAEVLYRRRDTTEIEDTASRYMARADDTHLFAARAHLSWTWRVENLMFATGVGMSAGPEIGTHQALDDEMVLHDIPIRRISTQMEWFARVGWVFDR
jgi:hypothetical protein